MFLFKNIVAPLLFPVPLCLEILIIGLIFLWFTRKQKTGKILVSLGVMLLALLSYEAVPNILLKPLEYQYPPLNSTTASDTTTSEVMPAVKWIAVLGGGHSSDPHIPISSQLSSASLMRLIEAIRLYRQLGDCKLVLSAGTVFERVSGAEAMAKVARAIGVNQQDLILESHSKDTKDQARLIQSIVGSDQFILVTSASHMPRTMALFKKLGMDPIPAPTGHRIRQSHRVSPGMLYPSSGGLSKAEGVVYEYLGLAWAKLRGQI